MMSNVGNLEQKIANLQLDSGNISEINKTAKQGKKIGPAVPPKPKKSQPQVPQSYTIKAPSTPSYSTVLNNSVTNEKSIQNSVLYANSPSPYVRPNVDKNVYPGVSSTLTSVSVPGSLQQSNNFYHTNNENFYQNEHMYKNELREKYDGKRGYNDEKNYYSNIGENIPSPQIPSTDERSNRTTRNVVYSNIEPAVPIPVPTPMKSKEKDIIYSNIQWNKPENTYCNIMNTHNHDDLPPPPEPTEYISCVTGNAFPPPPEELPPPPSPVSSSYSELRRATYHQSDYPPNHHDYPNDIYGPSSQSSSTYESIYEPINPRPPSQLSCNYSMYSGYGSASSQPPSKVSPVKEVDTLTDLLVQGMEDSQDDSEIYGICAHCGKKVEGEGTGCSAMDKVFHIDCFCCFVCQVNLQGKPFYSLEGKPYCEEDYLNTLEKCCVCTRPILDRILRATGKPYHPSCFTCVVCGQSLDGIPFTVDATNQIHCIQCFHKKFAPRCCVCKLPIMPEPGEDETVRVVALDRSFHIQCYKCEDCGLVLSSDAEGSGCYPLDDHVLCKSCNAKRVQALTSHMTTEL
ncbi:thyroid receptor-interacting protein 6 [Chelonus insularis]|uniref:thyroid receptor-interacting protein 6 n=1 Tax=Chelonus insularis TaxID=460826 RepID=UPI00158A204C|nr:thyroid receptor-interacting protein 6 [Chelonus insularis]XP_034940114.1 thyroid receptor-interacting protein 6 [Chelonus insularis]